MISPTLTLRLPRRAAAVGGIVVACGLGAHGALAQPAQPRPAGAVKLVSDRADSFGAVLIEPSSPIMNLFSRAEEGAQRRDWKFAIDSLQRVVDDPDGSLLPRVGTVPSDIVVYESTRLRALRRLIELPGKALTAYRILYDGTAKGLYDRAVATGDAKPLRRIVDRYVLTRHGDDACDLLASWLIDAGRYGETIDLLQDCIAILPDGDIPSTLLTAKLAAAFAASGRASEAEAVVKEYAAFNAPDEPEPDWLTSFVRGVADLDEFVRPESLLGEAFGQLTAPASRVPMPSVDPTLIDPVPWRYELPWQASELWKRVVHDDPNDPVALPATHAVTDGRRLFVRRPYGCAALDLDDLTVLWEVPRRDGFGVRSGGNRSERWSLGTAYEDYLIGTLALAEGVLCAIEWRDPMARRADGATTIQRVFRPGVARTVTASSNRLVAYDPENGALLWDRGRTFDPEDPLGQVEFRAGPIGVDGHLWVPFLENSDLWLAVLDPADGTLIHRILLGSLGDFDRLRGRVLPAAYADGLVFVPTARGVVFAVDANTHALRWATRYEMFSDEWGRRESSRQQQRRFRQQLGGRDRSEPERGSVNAGLPAPPVVARGLVLLLPRQNGELIALSANRGEFRWSTRAGGAAYILAADDERIWLGGRSVTCVSLIDGSILWSVPIEGTPTGWAVLSGGRILFPTAQGLGLLDAETGESLGWKPLPSSQPPLGNLLCVHDSMFSVDPSSVRKFPDIARTFDTALAQHKADSTDARVALRLAWMYLFRDEPAAAVDTLEALPVKATEKEPHEANAVAHVLVTALHRLAAEWDHDPGTALEVLGRALERARSPMDRLLTSLAIAEQQLAAGDAGVAYTTLWALALSDAADQTVTVDDVVRMSARLDINRRIRAMAPELGAAQLEEAVKRGLSVVAEAAERARAGRIGAGADGGIQTLRAITEMGFLPRVAASALIEWAEIETKSERFERAEQLLRRCVAVSTEPPSTLAGLARLYRAYRSQLGPTSGSAIEVLDLLAQEYGSVPIDSELEAVLAFGETPALGATVGEWVSNVRTSSVEPMDAPVWADGSAADPPRYVDFEPAWSVTPKTFQSEVATAPFTIMDDLRLSLDALGVAEPPRMVHFDESTRVLLGNRVIYHAGGDVVYCQDPATGSLLWQTTLRMPGVFTEALDANRGRAGDASRRAVADGQIAVINGNEGLYGVGLLTGRRLWVRPYGNSLRTGSEHMLDHRMAARDGYLAAMPREGYLTVMRMIDGSTVWERDLRGETVRHIEMATDRVITSDRRLKRVMLFDRVDGVEVARVHFRQPDPDNRAIHLVATGGVLCGPDADANTDAVMAVDLSDGSLLWRAATPKPLVQLFEPAPGYVGMGLLGGDLKIVDARTGDAVLDEHLPSAHAVHDAIIIDATVLAQAVTLLTGERRPALIALDLATGEELWRRNDLAAPTWATLSLDVYKGVVPVVLSYEQPGVNQNRDRFGLALIDVGTGELRALARDVLPPRSRARLNGEIGVWDNALIVGTTLGVQAYGASDAVRSPIREEN